MFYIFFVILGAFLLFLFIRLIFVLLTIHNSNRNARYGRKSARTLIILGSGGHTAEMIAIVTELNKRKYSPRFYVLADTDKHSESKIFHVESLVESQSTAAANLSFEIHRIKRSREVQQSFLTAILTTIQSIWQCVPLVYHVRPDLILCNGPGTCIPICLISFLFKVFCINTNCRIVFIESYCRTKSISLSGKILMWITDLFVVQWPQLLQEVKRARYFGRLL